MPKRVGRRFFLNTTSGLALALPFLPSLLPRTLGAQPTVAPRRFVGINSGSGQFVGDWYPAWAPAGYSLRDARYTDERADGTIHIHQPMTGTSHRWAPLADFRGPGLSNVLTNALDPYLEKMNLLRGIDLLQGTSHGDGMCLGNYAHCAGWEAFSSRGLGEMPTIDQVLAYSDRFYGMAPRRRSLELGTGDPSSMASSNYGVPGGEVENLPAYIDPRDVWDDLFGDFMSPDMPRENPNRSLINAIHGDYARLRDHSRLSTQDRQALERHMTFLDDIERELGATIGAGCVRPEAPPGYGITYPYSEAFDGRIDQFRQCVQLLVDVAAAAIRCDLTRVATFRVQMGLTDALGPGREATSYHNSDDVPGDWHDFAHDAADDPTDHAHIVSINRWVATDIFGRFLQQLDVEEADGRTYLDNSLVYWGGELSMDHYVIAQPTVIAGSAGGMLQTGRFVDYQKIDGGYANPIGDWGVLIPGLPHNRLLVTILQAMGLSPADYETAGRPGYGHTELFDGPYAWPSDAYDMGQIGAPLPGIWLGA